MSAPYEKYRGTVLWRTLTRALAELEQNSDLTVTTKREYVVGYLASMLGRKFGPEKTGEAKRESRKGSSIPSRR